MDLGVGVGHQLDEDGNDSSLNDSLDLEVGSVAQVGSSPASIDDDVSVVKVQQVQDIGKSRADLKGSY